MTPLRSARLHHPLVPASPPWDRERALSLLFPDVLPAWREVLLVAVSLLAVYFACYEPIWDPDTFWHLAVGREIWKTGHLMRTETFSFTAPGSPWEDTEWLFHVLAYPLWRLGGDGALAVATGLGGAAVALLVYLGIRRAGGGSALFAVYFLPLIPSFGTRVRFRPDLFSLAFAAVLAAWLLARPPGRPLALREMAGMAALFFLWAQLHGGWAFGLALAGSVWAGELLDSLSARRFSWRCAGSFALAGLLAALAVLANPYGWRVLWFPVKTLIGFADPAQVPIAEWEPTPFTLPYLPFHLLCLAAAGLLLAGWRRTTWREALFTGVQIFLGLYWNRYVALTIVALAPLAASRLTALRVPRVFSRAAWTAALCLAITCGCLLYGDRPAAYDLSQKYPVQEVAFLRARSIAGNLLNPYSVGGYLDWEAYPACRIFMDGRYFPYVGALRDYYQGHLTIPAFHAFLEKYPFDIALYPHPEYRLRAPDAPPGAPGRGPTVYLFPPEKWVPVAFGNYCIVLLKRQPRLQGAIEEYAYRIFRPDDLPYLLWAARRGLVPKETLAEEIRRALRENPRMTVGRSALEGALAALDKTPAGEAHAEKPS